MNFRHATLVHRITSLDSPDLQPYRTLRRPHDHLEQGMFVAEGEKVVRRLLASGLPILSMLLTEQWFEKTTGEIGNLPSTHVFIAERKLLETIVGFRMHQGIMAVGRVPAEPGLAELVKSSPRPRLFIALDGLVFAENVGVVVRNCAAFGAQAILVSKDSASPYLRRAVRNSMGTVFRIPVIHTQDLSETLTALNTIHGISTIVADAHTGTLLYDEDCKIDLCVVFGHEDSGVSQTVRSVASKAIRIPMTEGIDSLNVASASAVVLAEIARQRAK